MKMQPGPVTEKGVEREEKEAESRDLLVQFRGNGLWRGKKGRKLAQSTKCWTEPAMR